MAGSKIFGSNPGEELFAFYVLKVLVQTYFLLFLHSFKKRPAVETEIVGDFRFGSSVGRAQHF
jgi:hypothetical protein